MDKQAQSLSETPNSIYILLVYLQISWGKSTLLRLENSQETLGPPAVCVPCAKQVTWPIPQLEDLEVHSTYHDPTA